MLCAVSSIASPQTVRALEQSCRGIRFGDVVLLSDVAPVLAPASPVRRVPIGLLGSKEAYSHFMLKELVAHATRKFVLVVQWDGYVLDPGRWDPRFLDYDYIGAPWPQFSDGLTVGNGGFSLRSRRLLEQVAADSFAVLHPEDVAICRNWRSQLEAQGGLRFASPAIAARFSAERSGDVGETFGFHGLFNFPDVMALDELERFVAGLPARFLLGRDGGDFILRLAEGGRRSLAMRTLLRRLACRPLNRENFQLLRRYLRR